MNGSLNYVSNHRSCIAKKRNIPPCRTVGKEASLALLRVRSRPFVVVARIMAFDAGSGYGRTKTSKGIVSIFVLYFN